MRGVRILRNNKNRVLGFGDMKVSKEQKDKLQALEVRFLVRRANAYLQTG